MRGPSLESDVRAIERDRLPWRAVSPALVIFFIGGLSWSCHSASPQHTWSGAGIPDPLLVGKLTGSDVAQTRDALCDVRRMRDAASYYDSVRSLAEDSSHPARAVAIWTLAHCQPARAEEQIVDWICEGNELEAGAAATALRECTVSFVNAVRLREFVIGYAHRCMTKPGAGPKRYAPESLIRLVLESLRAHPVILCQAVDQVDRLSCSAALRCVLVDVSAVIHEAWAEEYLRRVSRATGLAADRARWALIAR